MFILSIQASMKTTRTLEDVLPLSPTLSTASLKATPAVMVRFSRSLLYPFVCLLVLHNLLFLVVF